MSDNNERLTVFLVGNLEKVYDLLAVFGVKVSCRLIGKHHRRRIHQSPTDGYSLLLTSGKLIRQVVFPTGKPERGYKLFEPVAVDLLPVHKHGERDIFRYIEHRNEVVELIDQPNLTAAEDSKLFLVLRIDILAVHQHPAACRSVHTAENVKQGGFAGAGGTNHGDKLSFIYRKRYVVQRPYLILTFSVYLCKVFNPQYFHFEILLSLFTPSFYFIRMTQR